MDQATSAGTDRKSKENKKTKKKCKWQEEHQQFRTSKGIDQLGRKAGQADHPCLKLVREEAPKVLSEREADAALLRLGVQLSQNSGLTSSTCMVAPIGVSLSRLKFSAACHPCLLPKKKYLYLIDGKLCLSGNSSLLPLMLQGLSSQEIHFAGPAIADLSPAQAQELSGNAFTSHIVAALLVGILVCYSL